KEEAPHEQQEWSSSLDQEDPPELPHIKEEQEELWTRHEGEQLPGLEEADIKFTFTPVPVKSKDDDEEKPQSSQLHQRQTVFENRDGKCWTTGADGGDCGELEPARNFNPDTCLQPVTHDEKSHSSELETDDSNVWEETREPQTSFNPLQNNEVPGSDVESYSREASINFSELASSFEHKGRPQKHNDVQSGLKPFNCSVCGKVYHCKSSLNSHMRLHSKEKHFSCSVCKKTFPWRTAVVSHMRMHTGEKPFSCSFCGARFARSSHLTIHLRVHTGEKPFNCSVCKMSFRDSSTLSRHRRVHTGEKPFSCSVCGKRFTQDGTLKRHRTVHMGEDGISLQSL
ncbi:oocyte zinc finger protein XlCOF6.1-like, partial [Sparus aurata]